MRIVVDQFEVFEFEITNVFDARIQFHSRQRSTFPSQLFARLVEVIVVEMQVAEGVNEIARRKTDNLCDHHGEQRVARDVERHPEK